MLKKNIVVNTIVFKELIDAGIKQWETFTHVKALGLSKVEVRREWIGDFHTEIHVMAHEAHKHNLELFYSVPVSLFTAAGLAKEEVFACLTEAKRMQAVQVKFTVGDSSGISPAGLAELKSMLLNFPAIVTVENDQTLISGKLQVLKNFLSDCQEQGVPVYCTYDAGNWLWVKEDPIANARALAEYVKYIHLKDAAYEEGKTVTRYLDEGQVDWRNVLRLLPPNMPMAIEYPCGEQPLSALKTAVDKLLSAAVVA